MVFARFSRIGGVLARTLCLESTTYFSISIIFASLILDDISSIRRATLYTRVIKRQCRRLDEYLSNERIV